MNAEEIKNIKNRFNQLKKMMIDEAIDQGVDITSMAFINKINELEKDVLGKLKINETSYKNVDTKLLIEKRDALFLKKFKDLENKFNDFKNQKIYWDEIANKPDQIRLPKNVKELGHTDKDHSEILESVKVIFKNTESLRKGINETIDNKIFNIRLSHNKLFNIGPDDHHSEKHTLESHIDSPLMKSLLEMINNPPKPKFIRGGGVSSIIAGSGITAVDDGIGNITISAPGSTTDEKVKYDASDPTAGYLSTKIIAGTGITLAEGTGSDADKLKISTSFNIADYVPYTGADDDVDLGSYNFTTLGIGTFGNTNQVILGLDVDYAISVKDHFIHSAKTFIDTNKELQFGTRGGSGYPNYRFLDDTVNEYSAVVLIGNNARTSQGGALNIGSTSTSYSIVATGEAHFDGSNYTSAYFNVPTGYGSVYAIKTVGDIAFEDPAIATNYIRFSPNLASANGAQAQYLWTYSTPMQTMINDYTNGFSIYSQGKSVFHDYSTATFFAELADYTNSYAGRFGIGTFPAANSSLVYFATTNPQISAVAAYKQAGDVAGYFADIEGSVTNYVKLIDGYGYSITAKGVSYFTNYYVNYVETFLAEPDTNAGRVINAGHFIYETSIGAKDGYEVFIANDAGALQAYDIQGGTNVTIANGTEAINATGPVNFSNSNTPVQLCDYETVSYPIEGDIAWNFDAHCLMAYDGSAWGYIYLQYP